MKLDARPDKWLPALRSLNPWGRLQQLPSSVWVILIIISMISLSLLTGFLSGLGRDTLVLALAGLPIAVFATWFLIRKFELAILLIPILALTMPFDLPTGTYSKVPIVLLLTLVLCGIWICSAAIRGNRVQIYPSPLNRPALVFCVVITMSFIWGIVWRDPVLRMELFKNFEIVQTASLLTFLASIGAALLIGNFVQTTTRLRFIIGTFLFFGTVMTILQLLKINHGVLTDRGLWGLWTVIPALGLLIAQPRLRWYWRVLLAVLIMANLYQTMIVNLLWKSGWVPTVVAMLVAIFMRSWRWFLVVLIIGCVAVYVERDFFSQMIDAELNEGAGQRIGMWEINLRVVSEHWLLGTGPAGYAPYYMTYYPFDARSTHNNYLDIIAQFGIVGSIVWLWFALISTLEGIRLYRRTPPGFVHTLSLIATSGWIGAQASMFFGDWVLPFAYNQTITGYKYTVFSWIFLGMLISIRCILQQEPANTSTTTTTTGMAGL